MGSSIWDMLSVCRKLNFKLDIKGKEVEMHFSHLVSIVLVCLFKLQLIDSSVKSHQETPDQNNQRHQRKRLRKKKRRKKVERRVERRMTRRKKRQHQ